MSGFSDYASNAALKWATGQVAMPTLPSVWLALFTTAPADTGSGGTEVSGGSYVRVQCSGTVTTNGSTSTSSAVLNFASVPAWVTVGMTAYDSSGAANQITGGQTVLSKTATTVTISANANNTVNSSDVIVFSAFGAPTGTAPSSSTNGATITFPQATAGWGTVTSFGFYDASTSGNLISWDFLGNFSWLPATVSLASPGTITAKAHGYSNGDNFVFSVEYGGTAPSFSAGNYNGILTVAGSATDSFNVTGVNTSSTGSGAVRKLIQQSIPINVTASFSSSNVTITLA